MVSATDTLLEDRVAVGGNPFPALVHAAKELFLDTFSPQRYLLRMMAVYEQRGQYAEAAGCAVGLGDYEQAFGFYDTLIRHGAVREGSFRAAELAESRGDYQRALAYRILERNLVMAGHDAARLGKPDLCNRYWQLVCHPIPETD